MRLKRLLLSASVAFGIFIGNNYTSADIYQSAYAAEVNYSLSRADEYIRAHKSEVKPRWYPIYHVAAPCGWVNDPNGFSFFDGKYHLFYQHYPYEAKWGPMHWGHVVSDDLAYWKHLPVALAPDKSYDIDATGGCFSGSAIEHDGKFYLIYTGHAESKDGRRVETQNIAISNDGIHFNKSEKNPVLKVPQAEDISSVDFRDPKVWEHDDEYYMIVGSKTNDTPSLGQILLFNSSDLESWQFRGIMARSQGESEGFMWECPNFAEVDGQEVLIISPMMSSNGKELHEVDYALGKLNYDSGIFEHGDFNLLDYGFDFYAPQVMQAPDGRCLLIGWLDNWDNEILERVDGWAGQMTIPRELRIKNGKIFSTPVKELENLRDFGTTYENLTIDKATKLNGIGGEVGEFLLDVDTNETSTFKIKLRSSKQEETVISYDNTTGIFKLNRDKAGKGSGGTREVKLTPADSLKMQIFLDKSSIEIFLNEGEAVLSTRIYPQYSSEDIFIIPERALKINRVSFYRLDKGLN